MSTSQPRDLLKWLLSLGLSLPVKNVKRDFSNGFLLGEVLSKYFPHDVQMHMFENVTSIERKRANWHVLSKFFKRCQWPVEQTLIDSVMNAEPEAAVMQFMDYAAQHEPEPTIEFDRRPRTVQFKPYTAKDYQMKDYDPKHQRNYWTLGTLGAEREDEELLAKREKAERLKEMAREVREQNLLKSAERTSRPQPHRTSSPKDKSTREKALDFAKSIPKPELRRTRSGREGQQSPQDNQQSALSELEQLELQHELDQQRVEAIQQEFMRRR
ncbi:hypothetical protein WJX72_003356 [[Myrmecia] bisecta]|uniref:Calponin-homology (CH) domain-containing protein n=1 Tax=[Myrmecia] bisecta TaxID=41462 RepID=A0AAW1QR11_9CHLO